MYDRSVLALKLKPLIEEKAKAKEQERKTTFPKSEKSNLPKINTTKELAKIAGVSHDTIHKVKVRGHAMDMRQPDVTPQSSEITDCFRIDEG